MSVFKIWDVKNSKFVDNPDDYAVTTYGGILYCEPAYDSWRTVADGKFLAILCLSGEKEGK